MAGWDCAASVKVCAFRFARLNATGNPVAGANNMIVTDRMVSLAASPDVVAGDVYEQKNGCGGLAVSHRNPDTTRWYNLTLTAAEDNPELFEILVEGVELMIKSATTRGYKVPELGSVPTTDYGTSIEAWSEAIDPVTDDVDAELPYFRWVFPKTKNWRLGDVTLENGVKVPALTGRALGNPNWDDGPDHDWFGISDVEADRAINVARDTEIPSVACGYQVIAAS